jgi:predicted NAD/FAD-binding protein
MNRLQKLNTTNTYCVTLNPKKKIPDRFVIKEMEYTHPQYTFESLATQPELKKLNGKRNTFFCGSYFGYGFHEDAVRSASDVAKFFGVFL